MQEEKRPDYRLEDALLGFIERVTAQESPDPKQLEIATGFAATLVDLWRT